MILTSQKRMDDSEGSPIGSSSRFTGTWAYASRLAALSEFSDVLAAYCLAMSRGAETSWPTEKVFMQRLRYMICYVLIGNEARWRRGEGEPPTLAALQRAAPASARQISSFVKDLRAGGYVEVVRADDARAIHLYASMALLQEIARSPLAFLEASERLAPTAPKLSARFRASAGDLSQFLGRSADGHEAEESLFKSFPRIVRVAEFDCGYSVLAAVFTAYYAATHRETPETALSYGHLSRRFRISRQHVANIFLGARREGWFTVRRGGREVNMSAAMVREFETWASGQMAHYRLLAEDIVGAG